MSANEYKSNPQKIQVQGLPREVPMNAISRVITNAINTASKTGYARSNALTKTGDDDSERGVRRKTAVTPKISRPTSKETILFKGVTSF